MAQITCIFNIKKFSIDRLSQIGRGKLSTTYNGKHEDGTQVAGKQLHYTPKLEQSTEEELSKILQIDHGNVVRFLDYFFSQDDHWMVFEYCDKFSLQKYMQDKKNNVDEVKKTAIMSQCANGLSSLHAKNIIHTRLKPRNILVKREGDQDVFKIGDYYMTTIFKGEHGLASTYSNESGDPMFFKPPEHYQQNMVYSASGDVFCLGLIFLALWKYQPGNKLIPEVPGHAKQPVGEVMYEDKEWTSDKLELIPTHGNICPVKALLNLMLMKEGNHRISASDTLQRLTKIQTGSIEHPVCEDEVKSYLRKIEQRVYSKLIPLVKEYKAIEPTHNLLLNQLDEGEKTLYFREGPERFLLKHPSGCITKRNNWVCYQEISSMGHREECGSECPATRSETGSSGTDSDSDTDLQNITPYRPLGPGSLLVIGPNMASDCSVADILMNNDHNGTLGCFAEVNINGCVKQFILSVRHLISHYESMNSVDIDSDVRVVYVVNDFIKAQFETVHGVKEFTSNVSDHKTITGGSCFGVLDIQSGTLIDISLLGPLSDFVGKDEDIFSGTKNEIDVIPSNYLDTELVVRKHGAKTGVTTGVIIDKNYKCTAKVVGLGCVEKYIEGRAFLVAYFDKDRKRVNGNKRFANQGDSGSLVYWQNPDGLKAIGLVHASGRDINGFKHVAVCVYLWEGIRCLIDREPAIESIKLYESYINKRLCYKYNEPARSSNNDVIMGQSNVVCCYLNSVEATNLHL